MKTLLTAFSAFSAIALLSAAEIKLGKPLALKEPVAIATLLEHPDAYAGKTVQVKGKITSVCEVMGCWMDLGDAAGNKIHIDAGHGSLVFPKDAAGKMAVTEGEFTKTALTREQAVDRAKEEAADTGRKFDPAKVKSGTVIYEIHSAGAVIISE